MGKKKEKKVIIWCPKCKIEAEKDEEKSDLEWIFYKTICSKCGGKTEIRIS